MTTKENITRTLTDRERYMLELAAASYPKKYKRPEKKENGQSGETKMMLEQRVARIEKHLGLDSSENSTPTEKSL